MEEREESNYRGPECTCGAGRDPFCREHGTLVKPKPPVAPKPGQDCTDGGPHWWDRDDGICQICRKGPVWVLETAQDLCRRLAATAFRAGFILGLSGGVLHRGFSEGDLDLMVVRRPQVLEPKIGMIFDWLSDQGWKSDERPDRRAVETRVPFRTCFRWIHPANGFRLELIVMLLTGLEKPQEGPFYGKPQAEERIQTELDRLAGL